MNPPDIHTPFLPPNLLPSRSSIISVSTGIHKLTDETHGFIAQMLVLQIHPQEIAWLTGISMRSVYHVQCRQDIGSLQDPPPGPRFKGPSEVSTILSEEG